MVDCGLRIDLVEDDLKFLYGLKFQKMKDGRAQVVVCCVENDAGNHNFKLRDQTDIDLMQERGLYKNASKMNNIDSLHPIEVFCFFLFFEREKR